MVKLVTCKYEISGKVQGVFFRKYTHQQGQALGLRGWVMNTEQGTVVGEMEGPEDKVSAMKVWLSTEGSPKSRIDKAEFADEKTITSVSFASFEVRR
eukprot:CAMPEP_0202902780 /NCGR_PEP_ID=MMETSP1392-20130828/17046_1 /ASSEMBLY_ACC=CAM_ASM_000868 /TAXON_ID=225041 /ORGANISM="Chlamydomonas chlamydogama, Strain SAG 11-48b" /LENGTH=96 /DNA_ID=CAMNT_0049589587 /DNA_START=21 /DNA_END=311 /DNA_ORIENTATION=+